MGTQGTGRKRNSNKERSTAEDDALNLIAREAEARLAAKRAARAEAREIRMRELERQQKEIFQVQKKYYGLNPKSDDRSDSKWGDIEQWMEDSERYSRPSQTHTLSDDDERISVGSRGSVRSDLDAVHGAGGSSLLSHKSKKKKKHKHKEKDRNGHDDDYSVLSSRASYASSDLYTLNGLSTGRNPGSTGSHQSSLYEDSLCSGSRRVSGTNSGSHPLEYSSYRSSNSRTSSRANSARTSPVDNCGSVVSLIRSTSSSRGLPRDLDDVTIPDFSDVDDRDYLEKGSRTASALSATTLASLGGTSSRRGSVETAITLDAETATREIKEIHELKDQIQDVESKYTQNLKEVKEALTEVEEKYRKAMVSNAQLDNEKSNLMYQVDTLKDSLTELEELLSESRRDFEDKVKEFDREKHAHGVLQFQFNEMKETLKQSEELLNEIRQLRMKQESFAREISDLQETVEWKDKKIGALERQKEYTDAIRNERDELREEVVKLKDILKKHGIVLGPDLSMNGDASETETDVTTCGDGAPQPAQGSTTSPSEGSSMLGSSQKTQLRSRGKEEVDQQQHGEVFEEGRTGHPSADRLSKTDETSRPVIENDRGLSQGAQIARPVANTGREIVRESASPAETIPQVNWDLDETDTQINGSTEENSTQPNKHLEGHLRKTELFVQEPCPQENRADHETSCQVDVNESESCHQEEIKDFESCPKEDLKCSELCPHVQDVKDPESSLKVDVTDLESHSQEEDVNDPELCRQGDAKNSESRLQGDQQDSKSYSEVNVKDLQSCPTEEDLKDPELCLEVDANSQLLPQDSIQSFDSLHKVDVKDSENDPQEDMNDSESFAKGPPNDSESCPQGHTVKDSESSPQVDVKDFESRPLKQDTKDPEFGLQADSKESESCPRENVHDSKLHCQVEDGQNLELCPHIDVKDSEFCSQEGIQDFDSCPQVDIKNFKSRLHEENEKEPELGLLVDVKNSDLCPQVEDVKDSDSNPQQDSKLCSQVQVAKDSEPCLQLVHPESNTELQHETAEASSDGSGNVLTKHALKARGKKKKKKRRGKKKGASLEEGNQPRDKMEENVTDQQNVQIADLGNDGSAAGCSADGHAIKGLKESTAMLNPDEQNPEHLEDGKVQTGPEAPIETFSQTKTDHKRQESLDSVEVQDGSEPQVDQADHTCEIWGKDFVLEDIGTVDLSGQGDTSSSGFVRQEGETSSETTNYRKDDSATKSDVESQSETAHFEAPDSQNQLHVMSTYDIGDSLQDAASSPSETPGAVNPDTFGKDVFQQEIQEGKEPETEREYRFQKENEELLNVVKLDNSLSDLDKEEEEEEKVVEAKVEPVADRPTSRCDEHDVDAASDTKDKARCEVRNDKSASGEQTEEHENRDQEVTCRDSYQQDSGQDVDDDDDDDEDEKGLSFDFDDMDLDAAMETVEKTEQREVEAVPSDELNPDNASNAEKRKVGGAAEVTPANPEQTDVEMAVEALPDECSNNNNSNIENPKDKKACAHFATSDNKYKQKLLLEVERLETADNINKESHMMEDGESSIAGLPQSTDKDRVAPGATSLPAEALDVVEKPQDLSATLNHRETHVSGKAGKKNGKKGKNKGKDECKVTYFVSALQLSVPSCHVTSPEIECMLPDLPHALLRQPPPWMHAFVACICLTTQPPPRTAPLAPPTPEIRLRKLVDEREKMIEQIKKLKAQVDQKSPKNGTDGSLSAEGELLENGDDANIIELQRDSSRQIGDMKFKLVKAEQEVTALEQNVSRLEGQVSRYKSSAENAEKVEDELKAEKRKLQRELRSALDKVDELESNNSHLNKRLEKMKSSRGMAQTP
ncbi:uncharacterized protein lrrfip1a [Vanacampus margaritifer]